MANDKENKVDNHDKKKNNEKKHKKTLNDGMNTPVPDSTSTYIPTESEAALIKQANNPLGDPNKI